jgi:hypothetical protein
MKERPAENACCIPIASGTWKYFTAAAEGPSSEPAGPVNRIKQIQGKSCQGSRPSDKKRQRMKQEFDLFNLTFSPPKPDGNQKVERQRS